MTERSSLNQIVQIGVESTHGTAVFAPKRLQSIGFEPSPKVEMDQFRPAGQKYKALATLGKEWTEASISGRGSYTELVYLLSSVVNTAVITTPGGGTNSRNWQFVSSSSADDSPKSFTVEHGSSVRADKFAYGLVTELGMTFNRQSIEISGSMLGQAMTDNITLSTHRQVTDAVTVNLDATVTSATAAFTSADVGKVVSLANFPAGTKIASINSGTSVEMDTTATGGGTGLTLQIGIVDAISLVPILPTQVSVYMDDTAAGLGGTQLTRAISAEFQLGGRFGPVYVLDATNTAYVNHVETEPDLTLNLMVQADSQGMALLTALREGDTKFIRIEAVGEIIEGAIPYTFTLDFAGKVSDTGGFSDADGVYAAEFTFVGVHDSTWGKAFEFNLINTLTAL